MDQRLGSCSLGRSDALDVLPAMPPGVVSRGSREFLSLSKASNALVDREFESIARAVPLRIREFATGRLLAREALAAVGGPTVALPSGPDRRPLWPTGFVGSITHCSGLCAAVVASSGDLAGIGVDAEPHGPLPNGVLSAVARPAELEQIGRLPPGLAWDRVLWSAKESVFKSVFPTDGRWRDFLDVEVILRADGDFCARSVNEFSLPAVTGRWRVEDGLVTALCWHGGSKLVTQI